MEQKDKYVGYKTASQLIQVPMGTLYGLVSKKQIPHYRISKRMVLFSLEEIQQWIKGHRIEVGRAVTESTALMRGQNVRVR